MLLLAGGLSTWGSFFELLKLIVILILILVATYYTTRWIGKNGLNNGQNKNIKAIETFRISQNKLIQILKVGEKYIVISVSKDHVEYLIELTEEELNLEVGTPKQQINFKDIFDKIKKK